LALVWSLVGLIVGPFLAHAIRRLPGREGLRVMPVCGVCGETLPFRAFSSLLASILGSRGGCGLCGAGPDGQGVAVELVTAAAFGGLFLRYGATPMLLLTSFYTSILIVVLFIDWRHRLILNRVTYPGLVLALILTPAVAPVTPGMTLLGAAFGGLVFGLVFEVGLLVYRKPAIALGDVKLAALVGAMAGYPAVLTALLLGTFAGAVASVALLATRRGSRHDYMPYGPALCVGTYLSFFINLLGA